MLRGPELAYPSYTTIDQRPTTAREALGAVFDQTVESGSLASLSDTFESYVAEPIRTIVGSPVYSPNELNTMYKDLGANFTRYQTIDYAKDWAARRQRQVDRESIIARGPQGGGMAALKLGTAFAATMVDPLNIAASFVPVAGPVRNAELLYGATNAGRAGNIALRAGMALQRSRLARGALEGAAGTALLEPLNMTGAGARQDDYTLADSFSNIVLGTALGGGLHWIGGAVADRVTGNVERRASISPAEWKRITEGAAFAPDSTLDDVISAQLPPAFKVEGPFARASANGESAITFGEMMDGPPRTMPEVIERLSADHRRAALQGAIASIAEGKFPSVKDFVLEKAGLALSQPLPDRLNFLADTLPPPPDPVRPWGQMGFAEFKRKLTGELSQPVRGESGDRLRLRKQYEAEVEDLHARVSRAESATSMKDLRAELGGLDNLDELRGRLYAQQKNLARLSTAETALSAQALTNETLRTLHQRAIVDAVDEGRPVREQVLRSYPDLLRYEPGKAQGAQASSAAEAAAAADLTLTPEMETFGDELKSAAPAGEADTPEAAQALADADIETARAEGLLDETAEAELKEIDEFKQKVEAMDAALKSQSSCIIQNAGS